MKNLCLIFLCLLQNFWLALQITTDSDMGEMNDLKNQYNEIQTALNLLQAKLNGFADGISQCKLTLKNYKNFILDDVRSHENALTELKKDKYKLIEKVNHIDEVSDNSTKVQELFDELSKTIEIIDKQQKEQLITITEHKNSLIEIGKDQTCGGNLTSTLGIIHSPNYPNDYESGQDCVWIIEVDRKNQIKINLTEVDFEDHPDCEYDYLEIRAGRNKTSPLLGRYCRQDQIPASIVSRENILLIHFHSDLSNNRKGFYLDWNSTTIGCSKRITSEVGIITSPNYPDNYDIYSNCEWQVVVGEGNRIRVFIDDMDIEKNDASVVCYDYLQIMQKGFYGNYTKYCGDKVPTAPILSITNSLRIRFISDHSVSKRGFALRFLTECYDIVQSGRRGIIETPNLPNANCSWIIRSPQENKIGLTILNWNTKTLGQCSHSLLQVQDNTSPPNITMLSCDSDIISNPIIFESDSIRINYIAGSPIPLNEIRMEWFIIGCGSNFIGNKGDLIHSSNDSICEWSINADGVRKIRLKIHELTLTSSSSDCSDNELNIFAVLVDESGNLQGLSICNTTTNTTVTSAGNRMLLRFTQSSARDFSFKASWDTSTLDYNQVLTSPSGIITSPNYPNNYNNYDRKTWLIIVDTGHKISLTFQDFQLEETSGCSYDSVAVYDGSNTNSNRIFFSCYLTTPTTTVTSKSNKLFITFESDGSNAYRGFKAIYSSVSQ